MHLAAVSSLSTTTLLVLGPAAMSNAIEYLGSTSPSSDTIPWIPLPISRTFFIAISLVVNSRMLVCLAFNFDRSSDAFVRFCLKFFSFETYSESFSSLVESSFAVLA